MTPSGATSNDELRRAKRHVGLKKGLLTHALVYVLVNVGLLVINIWAGGGRWHWFPLLGWGLGLLIHGIVTFMALRGDGHRDRMLAKELDRMRRDD